MERQADRGSSHSREVLAGDRQNDRSETDHGIPETPQASVGDSSATINLIALANETDDAIYRELMRPRPYRPLTPQQRRALTFMSRYRPLPLYRGYRVPNEIAVRACAPSSAHCVYRFYDGHEQLLYVGCTEDINERTTAHRWGSPFYDFIEITIVLWYPDKAAALAAERHSIKSESPIFNNLGRPAAVNEWLQNDYLQRYQRGYRRDF